MDVFYILTSAWKENHKICPIWNWFYVASRHVLSRCDLRERIHSPVSVMRIAFKD